MSQTDAHGSPGHATATPAGASVPVIVLGAVGICLDIVETLRVLGPGCGLTPLGFLDDAPALKGAVVAGLPVLGGIDVARAFPHALFACGIGGPSSFRAKQALIARTGLAPERFATIIHPSAVVAASARLGRDVIVLANCSIGAGAQLGDHVLMLQNCVVGHDSRLGERCILAAGVVISGNVRVGRDCYLGAAAVIRENLTIGNGSLLGLGSALVGDMPAQSTFYGNPARVRRQS
jgi:sugar O-acyltransferase (sialic acid O-acetyltransferase NeuD family)